MSTGKKLVRRSRPAGNDSPASLKNKSEAERSLAADNKNGTNSSKERDIEMTGNEKAPEKAAHPKLRSNLNYHRQNDAHHVLESDLEEQPLMVEEIDGFLSGAGPSGDPFEGYYENTRVQWEYQHDRRGGHMLFVENEDTGELVLTDLNGHGEAGGGGGEQDNDYEDSPLLGGEQGDNSSSFSTRPDVGGLEEFSIMEKFFLACYLFFQGLLAGFSMALIYIVEQAGSDSDLLANYQPSANEIRRIMFIFGAISSVGALESFTESWRRKRYVQVVGGTGDSEQSKRRQAGDTVITQAELESCLLPLTWVSLLCYFILFLILLAMAPTEVLISEKNGFVGAEDSPADAWVEFALLDGKFDTLFYRWKQLTMYRVTFALLGWISSCLVVLVRYLLNSKRDIAMNGMFEHIHSLRKKISSLQGDGFDPKMTVDDYHRLINIQKLGVQRSEAALRAKEEHMLEDLKK